MDDELKARLSLTRHALSLLRSPDFRDALRDADADTTSVIVLLDGDSVGYMCGQLRAAGGRATLVVAASNESFYILSATADLDELPDEDTIEDCMHLPHHASMGMFLEYIRRQPGQAVTFQAHPEVKFELIDEPVEPAVH